MKKSLLRHIAKCLCTLAVMAAPIATQYCRGVFYQEKEPDGIKNYV